jgi:hypothetical protein
MSGLLMCSTSSRRRRTGRSGDVKRGDLITIALSVDYGKPRPASVVQSDFLSKTDSALVCLLTRAPGAAPLYRLSLANRAATGARAVRGSGRALILSWTAVVEDRRPGVSFGASEPSLTLLSGRPFYSQNSTNQPGLMMHPGIEIAAAPTTTPAGRPRPSVATAPICGSSRATLRWPGISRSDDYTRMAMIRRRRLNPASDRRGASRATALQLLSATLIRAAEGQ